MWTLGGVVLAGLLRCSSAQATLRGVAGKRELFLDELSFLDGLELWQKYLILAGAVVVALLILVLLTCLCVRLLRKDDPALVNNPYLKDNSYAFDPNASGRTLVHKNAMQPSPALASFMLQNPVRRVDVDDDDASSSAPTTGAGFAGSNAAFSKRVSTRATGNDYGRLDSAAKDRIRSIRMEGNIMPIMPNPTSKAMKLLGVDETAVARPFDEDVATRMKKLAAKSGGGIYAPGFATAGLGGQIAQGFKERRAKQLEKARIRKEKEDERRKLNEDKQLAQGLPVAKPKPPAPKVEKEAEPPGPNKLAAFLQSTGAATAVATKKPASPAPSSKPPAPKSAKPAEEDHEETDSDQSESEDEKSIDDTI